MDSLLLLQNDVNGSEFISYALVVEREMREEGRPSRQRRRQYFVLFGAQCPR